MEYFINFIESSKIKEQIGHTVIVLTLTITTGKVLILLYNNLKLIYPKHTYVFTKQRTLQMSLVILDTYSVKVIHFRYQETIDTCE